MQGEVVLFNWIEQLREQSNLWDVPKVKHEGPAEADEVDGDIQEASGGQVAAPLDAEAAALAQFAQRIVHGEPFMEKRSTFQAHVAPVSCPDEVEMVMACLLQHNKIRAATHNIMAYRIIDEDKDTVIKDYDDDGEAAAGGRLLHLLHVSGAANVVVVVSRWFGGVLMGPQRFTVINNVARQLLEQCGYIGRGGAESAADKGRRGAGRAKK